MKAKAAITATAFRPDGRSSAIDHAPHFARHRDPNAPNEVKYSHGAPAAAQRAQASGSHATLPPGESPCSPLPAAPISRSTARTF